MFKNNLSLFWRHLRRQPIYAGINIVGLAVGMAACILIVLFIQDELSYEQMHSQREDIYRVLTIDKALGTNNQRVGITQPAIGLFLADAFPEVEAAVRVGGGGQSLLRKGADSPIYAQDLRIADPNFFDFFEYPFIEGDPKTALSQPYNLVLTQSLASAIFGDENPMGQLVQDGNGDDYLITGLIEDLPQNTHFAFDALGSMLTQSAQERENQHPESTQAIFSETWQAVAMPTYARLTAGQSTEGFDERLTAWIWENGVPENFEVTLQRLTDVHLGSTDIIFDPVQNKGDRNTVVVFAAIALLILLIAIVNYLNLSTARSTDRAREVGMRKVVGSSKQQLITQFLSESVLTALTALLLAIVLTWLAIPALNAISGSQVAFGTDNALLLGIFFLALIVVVGLLAGVYPAFALSSFKPISVLKGSFKSSKNGQSIRIGLVVFQFALSIALIGTTGMVQKQLRYIQDRDMGYDREQVMLFDMVDRSMSQDQTLFREQLEESSAFSTVATTGGVPGRTLGRTGLQPEGSSPDDRWIWSIMRAAPESFPAFGIEMAEGRNFDRNQPSDETDAVLINETAARQLGWDDPLEKRIFFGSQDSTGNRVIGVIKDFHFAGIHQNIEPLIAVPLGQQSGRTVVARVEQGRTADALAAAESVWRDIYPDYPFSFSFLDEEFQQIYERDTATGNVINLFSSLAIFIACLGLFGLVSFSTTQRTKEIGVRKVLGASSPTVVRLLVSDFVRWVALANLFAWPLAWYASSKWLGSFAYHIDVDPFMLVWASLITLGVALLTVVGQSWKTANMNPANALRYE